MTASLSAVILDPLGLHLRPAADFVTKARTFRSEVTIDIDGRQGDCKSLLEVLKLAIPQGATVVVTAVGPDEAEAVRTLAAELAVVQEPATPGS